MPEDCVNTLNSKRSLDASVMRLIEHWAADRSKDPSAKVGACVYDPTTGGMFIGYNGFPSGFPDTESVWNNRDPEVGYTKYDFVVHAEINAIRKALWAGVDLRRCWLFCTHLPCPRCMNDQIAPNGIKRVVYGTDTYKSCGDREKKLIAFIALAHEISLEKFDATIQ